MIVGWKKLLVKLSWVRLQQLADEALLVFRSGGGRAVLRYLAARYRYHRSTLQSDYIDWSGRYDALEPSGREAIRQSVARQSGPLISIVLPTCNTPLAWLAAAIDSVRAQLYTHWQLCIVDDASNVPGVTELIRKYASIDSRILYQIRDSNGHICATSNQALAMAEGEFIALLDHDDLLTEDALYRVTQLLASNPDLQLIYSDEDKLDSAGRRFEAYHKSDWNPDLFYGQNMISHLGVYRTKLVKDVGSFRLGFEGSQDYDLALRCIECLQPEQIGHIPRVLYHWRVHSHSTASTSEAKPYAKLAGQHALQEHFQRRGMMVDVDILSCGYRVIYPLPVPAPLVTVIIRVGANAPLLGATVASVRRAEYSGCEIIITGRHEPSDLNRAGCADSQLLYAANENAAVARATGEVVLFLDAGLVADTGGWLREMISQAMRDEIGAVGARLVNPDLTVQHAGLVLGQGIDGVAAFIHQGTPAFCSGYFGRAGLAQALSAVSTSCLAMRSSLLREIGGLEQGYQRPLLHEVNLCLRLRELGLRNLWTPFAQLYWQKGAVLPSYLPSECSELQRFRSRWGDWLRNDPYCSPNHQVNGGEIRLAYPPGPTYL